MNTGHIMDDEMFITHRVYARPKHQIWRLFGLLYLQLYTSKCTKRSLNLFVIVSPKNNVTGAQCESDSMTMFFKTEGGLKFDYDDSPKWVTPEDAVATSARWFPKQSVQNINPGVQEQ